MHDTLAKLSKSAYDDLFKVKAAYPCFSVDLVQNNGTQVYIFKDSDFIIFAFRGTEPDKLRDVITDLQFRKVPVAWGSIHTGFHTAIELVWPELWKRVQANDDKHIFITGHSLGGALAKLFAMMLSRQAVTPTAVVTFGAPRVGNRTFKRLYNAILGKKTFRYHFKNDPVPHIPLWPMGFRHAGQLRWWCGQKLRKRMGIWAWVKSVLRGNPDHHAMQNYVDIWPKNKAH